MLLEWVSRIGEDVDLSHAINVLQGALDLAWGRRGGYYRYMLYLILLTLTASPFTFPFLPSLSSKPHHSGSQFLQKKPLLPPGGASLAKLNSTFDYSCCHLHLICLIVMPLAECRGPLAGQSP